MVCLSPSLVIVKILFQIIWGLQRRKGVELTCLGSSMMWWVAPCKVYNSHNCFLHADFLCFSDITDWQVRSLFVALFFRRLFTAFGSPFPIQSIVVYGSSFQGLLHGVKGHFCSAVQLSPRNARKTEHRLPDGQERLTALKNFQQCDPQLALLL